MKLGSETGSLINHLMSGPVNPVPQVGMGGTVLGWSDRHAVTVIAVSKSGSQVTVQYDKAIRTDSNGMSESQQYRFEADPEGMTREYVMTKTGWRERGSRGKGNSLKLGERMHYHDYSF